MPWGPGAQEPDPSSSPEDEGRLVEERGRSDEEEGRSGEEDHDQAAPRDTGQTDPPDPELAALSIHLRDLLSHQLAALHARRVPVRGVHAGPVAGVGRLRWADGTVMLVSAVRPGELARVARALAGRKTLTVGEIQRREAQVLLTLHGAGGRHPVQVLVIGPDQPD